MDFKALRDSMELLEKHTRIRRLLWASIAVMSAYALLFGLAALITAIRWW